MCDFTIHNIQYTITDNFQPYAVTISGNTISSVNKLLIHSSVTYNGINYSITSIGNNAFQSCSFLTGDLIIPNSVTSIGNNAFQYCSGLTGILTIGDSVTTIGKEAFQGCFGLTRSLTIPDSVTQICDGAFRSCSGFTGSLTIGNSVTTIGNEAFRSCYGFIGQLTIPDSVTTIGNSAFYYCPGLTGSLTIPNRVTTIGTGTFYKCSGFTGRLVIGDSVLTIGTGAFYNCTGLTSELNLPNGVTSIGVGAFYNCVGFTGSLTICDSVLTIGTGAFYNCDGLINVIIADPKKTTVETRSFIRVGDNNDSSITFYNTKCAEDINDNWSTNSQYFTLQVYKDCHYPLLPVRDPIVLPILTDHGIVNTDKKIVDTKILPIRDKKIGTNKKMKTTEKYFFYFNKNELGKNLPSQKTIIIKNRNILCKWKMSKIKNKK